jgi:hypothetical protein
MILVARVLTRLARLTKVSKDAPMMARALSLSKRAITMHSPSEEVKLARASILEECGMLEQSERVLMNAVLEHTESMSCVSAYSTFLKNRGELTLAQTLDADIERKASLPVPLRKGSRQLSAEKKNSLPPKLSHNSAPEKKISLPTSLSSTPSGEHLLSPKEERRVSVLRSVGKKGGLNLRQEMQNGGK